MQAAIHGTSSASAPVLSRPGCPDNLGGGPDMAPTPPTFGRPRPSRGRPRQRSGYWVGAPTWPPHPQRSGGPGQAKAASSTVSRLHGAGDETEPVALIAVARAALEAV